MATRDPSLHIRKSDLVDILNQINLSGRRTGNNLANEIFEKAQEFQIKDRYLKLLDTNKDTKQKVVRSIKSDTDVPDNLVEKFNLLLTTYRQKVNPHGKVKPIRKDHRDYLMLKEVAKLAHEFVEEFDISPVDDGYKEFIEIGYGMMRKYALNRYKYYASKISELFSDKLIVLMDENKKATLEFYTIWKDAMIEYTQLTEYVNIEDDFKKYSCMVLGRIDADNEGADYTDWIVAQFEGLSFLDAIPEISQFYGDGAVTRYERYVKNSVEYTDNDSITNVYD